MAEKHFSAPARRSRTCSSGVDVTYYVVADAPLPSAGILLLHARLSRPITSVSTCRRVLRRIRRYNRSAFMVQVRNFR